MKTSRTCSVTSLTKSSGPKNWPAKNQRSLGSANGFRRYAALLEDRAWNRSLSALYATRSYEAGLEGTRRLIELTAKFPATLNPRQYDRNLIRIGLLELTCLDRLDRLGEYLESWGAWRSTPLPVFYNLSRRRDPRILPFVIRETDTHLLVHFLYLQRARKELIERKAGTNFRRHARQEDLTEEEMRERLRRIG